jgi:DNA polymerase-1
VRRAVIIDADTLIYQASYAVEENINWGDGLWTVHSDVESAKDYVNQIIHRIREELDADKVLLALSDYDNPNWRKHCYPAYKSNRPEEKRKPLVWTPLRAYMFDTFLARTKPTLEGDDALGILMTHPDILSGWEKVCVSIDKDMATIPGLHTNHVKAWAGGQTVAEYMTEVTEAEADQNHLLQAIAGDTVDGYPGAPGWGMVRARRVLEAGRVLEPYTHVISRGPRLGVAEERWEPGQSGTTWAITESIFQAAGKTPAFALAMAQVARILRWTDYDYERRKAIPWTP